MIADHNFYYIFFSYLAAAVILGGLTLSGVIRLVSVKRKLQSSEKSTNRKNDKA